MTRLERKAALAVAAAAVGVTVAGVSLLKKHAKYLAKKAAATFGEDNESSETEGQTVTDEAAEKDAQTGTDEAAQTDAQAGTDEAAQTDAQDVTDET